MLKKKPTTLKIAVKFFLSQETIPTDLSNELLVPIQLTKTLSNNQPGKLSQSFLFDGNFVPTDNSFQLALLHCPLFEMHAMLSAPLCPVPEISALT